MIHGRVGLCVDVCVRVCMCVHADTVALFDSAFGHLLQTLAYCFFFLPIFSLNRFFCIEMAYKHQHE